MDYQMARVSLRDIRAIHALERQIFPKDAYPYVDLVLLLLTPSMVNRKAVSTSTGDLLGFIAVADVWFSYNPAWVITLGVGTAYQNQGIGRQLLTGIEGELRARRLRLTVRSGNSGAIHLYQTSGYEVIRTAPHYYHDGEDGIIMEKTR